MKIKTKICLFSFYVEIPFNINNLHLCSSLGKPLYLFFFTQSSWASHTFTWIPNHNVLDLTLFIASSLWPKLVSWKVIFTIMQMLVKLSPSRLAVHSHRSFDLLCQEIDCFISGLSVFLGSWGRVTVLQFILMFFFFRKQSPRDIDLFIILVLIDWVGV